MVRNVSSIQEPDCGRIAETISFIANRVNDRLRLEETMPYMTPLLGKRLLPSLPEGSTPQEQLALPLVTTPLPFSSPATV